MSKTVLVTGGTGFVGLWCIVELLKRGYTVRTTVRSLSKTPAVRGGRRIRRRSRRPPDVLQRPT